MSDFEQFRKHANDQDVFNVPGGLTGGAPPVPIPNTEVKPSKADDTAAARPWESRTLPGCKQKPAGESQQAFLFEIQQQILNETPLWKKLRNE